MPQIVGPDGDEMREYILSLVDWKQARRVLDVGSGAGYDLYKIGARLDDQSDALSDAQIGMAAIAEPNQLLCGIDVSPEKIAEANADHRKDSRYNFAVHNFAERLPFDDGTFDLVYSHNVLECATDRSAFLAEVNRVLKPAGQFLCAHFDWDSAMFNGTNKQLIRKITHAYADWQQDWMDACDGWMGRRLWGSIQRSGFFESPKLFSYQIINDRYEFPLYGFKSVENYAEMIAKNLVSEAEYLEFKSDMEDQARSGDYLFCITTFIYLAQRLGP